MERFFKKTSEFIFQKQKGIFSSAIIISLMIVLSSLSGFLRYRILAGYFNKDQLDIFFAAFRIPDLIYEILITGAITSTFIPIYLKYKNNQKDLSENISSIINLILLVLTILIIITLFFIKPIITFITPGYNQAKLQQIINFSRILLFGQLPFFILANFLTGIGQANKIFFLSAIAPVIYNLTTIIFTILFHKNFGLNAAIYGVVLGSFFLFLIQLPLLFQSNFIYKLIIKKTTGLIEFFKLIGPRILTVITAQIDATIDLILTTFMGSGSYTIFYFAQHLQLLPVSVIGIAFGQASLPYLTELYQEKKMTEFRKIITDSILNLLFLIMPIAAFFIFARTPLIRFFFGGQKFDWSATVQTAITLSYFSFGLPFHTIYYFLTRCFYAMMNSKIPFYASLISIIINTLLSLIFVFIFHLPVWSLGISFSIAIMLNSLILFFILTKKIDQFNFLFIIKEIFKIFFSLIIASIIAY
ncbi:MAG: murein biosynthesis integral membrane protein MurJ, partial [Microgenomates group bacterium]